MSVLQTLCPRHLFSLCGSQVFNVSRHWLNWTNLFSTGSQCVNVCVCVCTWTIVLGNGCVSSSVIATKLNPLKSWWALALGGTPGESEARTQIHSCESLHVLINWMSGKVVRKKGGNQNLPLGVFAVNSGSKWNVSSGRPAAGLKGGWISLRKSFWWERGRRMLILWHF